MAHQAKRLDGPWPWPTGYPPGCSGSPAFMPPAPFLLLARYVPNVAKEELWDQCKKYEYWRPTDDRRPTNDRPQGPFTHFGKISNGHNSATCQPIPFMFGSRVGFLGMADPTAPFPAGSNSRWRPAAILENFKRPYLSNALSDSLYVCTQTILCPRSLNL